MNYKILIVAPPYKSVPIDGFGGIEKVMIQRGKTLASMGGKISFVLPENSTLDFPDKIYYIKRIKRTDNDDSHVGSMEFFKSYMKLNINENYDIMINESPRYDLINYLNFKRLFNHEKTIDVLHGNGMRGTRMKRPFLLKTPILGALNTHMFEGLKQNRWRTAYFPNGITIPEPSNVVSSGENFFIFIGRLTPSKGPDIAIKFAIKSNTKLFIFGPIEDRNYYESVLKAKIDGNKIIYMGEQPWNVVESRLRKSSALLFTSAFDDPQPAVLLESISYGVPILALKPAYYSGFFDICNRTNSVVAQTVDELVSIFEEVFSISRKKVYDDAREKWSWEKVAKQYYVPVFNQIANHEL